MIQEGWRHSSSARKKQGKGERLGGIEKVLGNTQYVLTKLSGRQQAGKLNGSIFCEIRALSGKCFDSPHF